MDRTKRVENFVIKKVENFEINKPKSVTVIIEETAGEICDKFCKYTDTINEECECQWIREGNRCPLDRLF